MRRLIYMKIIKSVKNEIAVLKIEGDFSFNELEQFQKAISPIISSHNKIAVDLEKAIFSDMTIFGELVKFAGIIKERNGKFFITNYTPEIQKYITKSKFDNLVILG